MKSTPKVLLGELTVCLALAATHAVDAPQHWKIKATTDGWQLWQHREELTAGKDIFGAGFKGDLGAASDLIRLYLKVKPLGVEIFVTSKAQAQGEFRNATNHLIQRLAHSSSCKTLN